MIGLAVLHLLTLVGSPQWIWAPGRPVPDHVFFRRVLDLPSDAEITRFEIRCNDDCDLYINGLKENKRTISVFDPGFELDRHLRAGRNVLAVDVRNNFAPAGLLIHGSAKIGSQTIDLSTGPAWRCSLTPGYGWTNSNDDDSSWTTPKIVGPEGELPQDQAEDRLDPMLRVKPARPIKKAPTSPWSFDLARNWKWPSKDNEFGVIAIPPITSYKHDVSERSVLSVDFGRELSGWVEVSCHSPTTPRLGIQVGECSDRMAPFPTFGRGADGVYVFRLLPLGGYTGFRFARIHFIDARPNITSLNIRAIWRVFPASYEGEFSCSDPLLTRIWEMGAYTVRLNLDPQTLGAVLRGDRDDRYPWMGADRVAHHTMYDCFGDYQLAKSDLESFVKPGSKRISVNNIPGSAMDWIIGLYDYWMYSGDTDEVRKHLADTGTILDQYGSLETPKGWLFTDWDNALYETNPETVLAFQAKYCQAALDAKLMALALNDRAAGARAEAHLKKFEDYLSNSRVTYKLHSLTNALLAKAVTQATIDEPVTTSTPYFTYYVLEALSVNGENARAERTLRDYWGGMLSLGATTTMENFLPEWTKTLKPNQRPPDGPLGEISWCHPSSSGATPWISEHVLGVTPDRPGFASCQLDPCMQILDWAKGKVPTPHGPISVSWKKVSDGHSLEVSAPSGVQVDLVNAGGHLYRIDGERAQISTLPNGTRGFVLKGGVKHVIRVTLPLD
jgi:hypothetical protein